MIEQNMIHFIHTQKWKTTINERYIDDVFESMHPTSISNVQKSLGKNSGWIIDSVIEHNINISKYNPSVGSSYIKLPKKLHHPRKDFD